MGSLIACIVGISSGLVAGSALSAFYIALGVFSKSAVGLGVKNAGTAMAASAAAGVTAGTVISIFDVRIGSGAVCLLFFGLFAGIFVGIFIACLAEVIGSITVLKGMQLNNFAIKAVLAAFAAGKLAGSLVYWLSSVF